MATSRWSRSSWARDTHPSRPIQCAPRLDSGRGGCQSRSRSCVGLVGFEMAGRVALPARAHVQRERSRANVAHGRGRDVHVAGLRAKGIRSRRVEPPGRAAVFPQVVLRNARSTSSVIALFSRRTLWPAPVMCTIFPFFNRLATSSFCFLRSPCASAFRIKVGAVSSRRARSSGDGRPECSTPWPDDAGAWTAPRTRTRTAPTSVSSSCSPRRVWPRTCCCGRGSWRGVLRRLAAASPRGRCRA